MVNTQGWDVIYIIPVQRYGTPVVGKLEPTMPSG
jgi:hypothetical protein